jgi:hypothetical protein
VIDTGSPFSWFPRAIWSGFQAGTDFEWLPFPSGYQPPLGQTAGWTFRFQMARLLVPIMLFDTSTELHRTGVIVQFAEGNPAALARSNAPPYLVVGLWGGLLEGTKLAITTNPQTGGVDGMLEF